MSDVLFIQVFKQIIRGQMKFIASTRILRHLFWVINNLEFVEIESFTQDVMFIKARF